MADGPGKYDAETTAFRLATGGRAVLTIVFGGRLGNGFEVQAELEHTSEIKRDLAKILRSVADQIERSR